MPWRTFMKSSFRILIVVASLVLAAFSGNTWSQTYPSKPVSIVVTFSAGAPTDVIARLLAEKLAVRLGQPVLVDNRVGAAGVIGTNFVARSPADGYTLLFTPSSIAFANLVVKTGPTGGYDAVNDFTPIIEVGNSPIFLYTGSGTGYKSFNDAAVAAKTKKLAYGSAGAGSILHIIGEAVNKSTGVDFVHVPYKGVAPAVSDVMGGHIPLTYAALLKPFISTGKLIPLAVTGRQRTILAPEVPTLQELGYKIDLDSWYGLFGPKNMPAAITKTLNEHLNEILKMPDVVERMASFGATPGGGSPQTLAKINATDVERIGKIIKELNIQAD